MGEKRSRLFAISFNSFTLHITVDNAYGGAGDLRVVSHQVVDHCEAVLHDDAPLRHALRRHDLEEPVESVPEGHEILCGSSSLGRSQR